MIHLEVSVIPVKTGIQSWIRPREGAEPWRRRNACRRVIPNFNEESSEAESDSA